MLNAVLLVALGVSFYLLGSRLFAVALPARWRLWGLLVTDRYLELFAFGGLLQAAAVIAMCLGVVGLFESVRRARLALVPWIAGRSVSRWPSSRTSGRRSSRSRLGWSWDRSSSGAIVTTARACGRPSSRLAWSSSPWALFPGGRPAEQPRLPANPASLAYRGPDRLFVALFSYPPTLAIVALGAAVIAWGTFSAARRGA